MPGRLRAIALFGKGQVRLAQAVADIRSIMTWSGDTGALS